MTNLCLGIILLLIQLGIYSTNMLIQVFSQGFNPVLTYKNIEFPISNWLVMSLASVSAIFGNRYIYFFVSSVMKSLMAAIKLMWDDVTVLLLIDD